MAASDKIPLDKREDVRRIVLYVKRTPSPPKEYLEWLFDVFNTYYPSLESKSIDCRTDRLSVINQLYACVILWKRQEESSQK